MKISVSWATTALEFQMQAKETIKPVTYLKLYLG